MGTQAPFGYPGQAVYLDGQQWLLEKGVDFSTWRDPRLVVKDLQGEAAVYGLKLYTQIQPSGNIVVQVKHKQRRGDASSR